MNFFPNIDHETFVRIIGHMELSVKTAKCKVAISIVSLLNKEPF